MYQLEDLPFLGYSETKCLVFMEEEEEEEIKTVIRMGNCEESSTGNSTDHYLYLDSCDEALTVVGLMADLHRHHLHIRMVSLEPSAQIWNTKIGVGFRFCASLK